MNILLVEPNRNLSYMICKYLEMHDIKCDISYSGRSALLLIKNSNFDIVLLEPSLPSFDGFDIIEDLKNRGILRKKKIILLTSTKISKDEIDELLSKGVYCCLKKPIEPSELVDVIKSFSICTNNLSSNESQEDCGLEPTLR